MAEVLKPVGDAVPVVFEVLRVRCVEDVVVGDYLILQPGRTVRKVRDGDKLRHMVALSTAPADAQIDVAIDVAERGVMEFYR